MKLSVSEEALSVVAHLQRVEPERVGLIADVRRIADRAAELEKELAIYQRAAILLRSGKYDKGAAAGYNWMDFDSYEQALIEAREEAADA